MKPRLSRADIENLLVQNGVTDKVALVGIRGYYLDSMGKAGKNDRNIYDDAIFVISRNEFEPFRANTDPSINRKGVATMKTGVHRYHKGKHKNRYWALRLVGDKVPVTRDGQGDSIGIALNIHKGGRRTTGSLGCQTLTPDDWDDFIELVYDQMDEYGQKTIPYLLVEEIERRTQPNKPVVKPAASNKAVTLFPTDNVPQNQLLPILGGAEKSLPGLPDISGKDNPLSQLPNIVGQVGTRPIDEAIKVTVGGAATKWLTGAGGVGGLVVMVRGFLSDNTGLIIAGIVCATIVVLALIFRTVIMDYARMQLFGDPNKYNVK